MFNNYHQLSASIYKIGMDKLPDDILQVTKQLDFEHTHEVPYKWRDPEYDRELLMRKVQSGEIFI